MAVANRASAIPGATTASDDFNGDGAIDYTQINCTGSTPCEGDCANACDNHPGLQRVDGIRRAQPVQGGHMAAAT